MSDFCRKAVLGKKVRYIEGLPSIVYELNKIGTNINLIAVTANQGRDGAKWQCSKQYLKHFREQSDEFCRQYNLHVIERGNRRHQSSGEYKAYRQEKCWKAMFTVRAGACGLKDERNINGYPPELRRLFKANIYDHFKVNKGLLELALDVFSLLQDAFLEIGSMMFHDNPTELQDWYFSGMELADFDRMTREEIEAYLKCKKLEQLQKKALAERENLSQNSGGIILACVAETLKLIMDYRNEQHQFDDLVLERENEYEL